MKKEVFIITHKNVSLPVMEDYKGLMVGSAMHDEVDAGFLRDDSGDNISEYNDSYCELTGLYWIWKNISCDVVGLVHYHRFFADVTGFNLDQRFITLRKKNAIRIIDSDRIDGLLRNQDIILKKSMTRKETNRGIFELTVPKEILGILEQTINEICPDYAGVYEQLMDMHYHFNGNMFIGKKAIVDEYCEWLFPILSEVDEKHKKTVGSRYHNREIGYLGEILLGVWIVKNNIPYVIHNVADTYKIKKGDYSSLSDGMLFYPHELFLRVIHNKFRVFR